MTTISAVCEDGVLRPEGPVHLEPGTVVEVVLPPIRTMSLEELRAAFPNAVGIMPKEDAEELMRIIDEARMESMGSHSQLPA